MLIFTILLRASDTASTSLVWYPIFLFIGILVIGGWALALDLFAVARLVINIDD